jgi:hypothetical protein
MLSQPTVDSVNEENDKGTDDDCTLADVMKGKKAKTSQEGQSSLGGDSLPSHPKGPRDAIRKHKSSAALGDDEDETPT